MSNIVLSQAKKLAESFGIEGDAQEIVSILKATAFRSDKGEVSDAQLAALLIVAGQYGLNPWTKEIYAFPDKKNGIVPVVGVDGWARIINEHPQFDGMEFRFSENMVRMPGANVDAPEWMESPPQQSVSVALIPPTVDEAKRMFEGLKLSLIHI